MNDVHNGTANCHFVLVYNVMKYSKNRFFREIKPYTPCMQKQYLKYTTCVQLNSAQEISN